ncbi:MAG: FAD-binding oxidoreductase [Polyangiales bacterium]
MSGPRVVIVGAGIMGLATAWNLARRGIRDITVVDRGYLCGGASGRNGGGVRAQFSSEDNVRLMRESIEVCRDFAAEMGINVWFRQGGYLFLARGEARAKALEASVALQNRCGLATRMLDPRDALKVVPELDVTGVTAASFNPDDGVVFPWPFVWGYARAAQALGATIRTFTEVVDVVTRDRRVTAVRVRPTRLSPLSADDAVLGAGEPFDLPCDELVVCAGAWSPEVGRMVGLALPNKPHRHEICSTDPLKPWLGPLVADLSDGLYFSQSMRGEIVGGVAVDPVPDGIDQRSSRQFLATYARALVRCVPRLARVKVLRQWAGCYDLTPDGGPIVGRVDAYENLSFACGFMGHGFMMAPVVGRLLAEHVATGETTALFRRWSLSRFARGELLNETMIIG